MDATLLTTLDWGLKFALLFGGWFMKVLFDKIKTLELADTALAAAVSDLRIALPTVYAQRSDIEKLGDGMFTALRRIEDKLDGKEDRKKP